MKRRLYTPATAWPAFADLMTILAIVGLAGAGIVIAEIRFAMDSAEPTEDPTKLLEENAELREAVETLTATVAELHTAIAQLRAENETLREEREALELKVAGFNPCWRGERGRVYYFTFDITYLPANDEFEIGAHSDMNRSYVVEEVRTALPLLREYPLGAIDRQDLALFSERVEDARRIRYGGNCKFAVTINGEAPGNVASFIREDLGLYPVSR